MDPSYMMSEEDMKRQTIGKCWFTVLCLFSTTALVCGLYASTWCDFLDREVVFTPDFDLEDACAQLGFPGTVIEDLCNALMSKHGVGFYGWLATFPAEQQACFDYILPIPGGGYISPEFDTKFNAARAFSMTANILGAFAWFTLVMSSCCRLDQDRLVGMTGYFFLACFFQGLSLLILRSDICEVGFFQQYFDSALNDVVLEVQCSLGSGAKLAICATVCYFLCNNITPLCVVPEPIGYTYNRAPMDEETHGRAPGVAATASEVEDA